MTRVVGYIAALALIVGGGIAQGVWTDRWAKSSALDQSVALLAQFPEAVGDWKSAPMKLDPRAVEIGEIAGYKARRFVRSSDGKDLQVLLLCGRPGPISVHTPEWCYGGAGFIGDKMPGVLRVDTNSEGKPKPEFRQSLFRDEKAPGERGLLVCWGWNGRGPWEAPENPRVAYAPLRSLYKLYVVAPADGRPRAEVEKECRDFLAELLPEIDKALSSTTAARPVDAGATPNS